MASAQTLRCEMMRNVKIGFVNKLRLQVEQSRYEQMEVEEYMKWMDLYKQVSDNPFNFTFDHIISVEDALDAMIGAAVEAQRQHRDYAKQALTDVQS